MDEITIIIVSYNTKELLENCYNSIRKHLPFIKIIIVDGSEASNPCSAYTSHLNNRNTIVLKPNYNIGHGKGMDLGISKATTKYVCVVDSDTIMNENPLPEMLKKIGNGYGIGKVIDVNDDGINVDKGLKYLHPYFALINRSKYYEHDAFFHHGAPCLKAMSTIFEEELINFNIEDYIIHLGRGTRLLQPKEFNYQNWEKYYKN